MHQWDISDCPLIAMGHGGCAAVSNPMVCEATVSYWGGVSTRLLAVWMRCTELPVRPADADAVGHGRRTR